jgi:hypothetical protein
MRLNEIKPVISDTVNLAEGVIPPHISMTLGQIINDGKITNPVQIYVLGAMLEMFKNGQCTQWPRQLVNYQMVTSSDLIEAIKTLDSVKQAQFAQWVLNELQVMGNYESQMGLRAPFVNPHMNPIDWVNHVLQAQD